MAQNPQDGRSNNKTSRLREVETREWVLLIWLLNWKKALAAVSHYFPVPCAATVLDQCRSRQWRYNFFGKLLAPALHFVFINRSCFRTSHFSDLLRYKIANSPYANFTRGSKRFSFLKHTKFVQEHWQPKPATDFLESKQVVVGNVYGWRVIAGGWTHQPGNKTRLAMHINIP